eukprot:150136-Hanusia_phi.AAC.2
MPHSSVRYDGIVIGSHPSPGDHRRPITVPLSDRAGPRRSDRTDSVSRWSSPHGVRWPCG